MMKFRYFYTKLFFNNFSTDSHTYMAAVWLSCANWHICMAAPLRAIAGVRADGGTRAPAARLGGGPNARGS